MPDFRLVRQPVFGSTGSLMGYDIRFTDANSGGGLARSLLTGSFDVIRKRLPAFVTVTRDHLFREVLLATSPAATILVIPRDLALDTTMTEAVINYHAAGGSLALDDIRTEPNATEALLPLARWVRIDSRTGNADVLTSICTRIGISVGGATVRPQLIASHVETPGHYDAALKSGFNAFQGVFFSRPEPLPATDMPSGTVAAIRLLGMARSENIHDRELEEVIATDPVLTYQLLRLVNSAALGGRGVNSIGQAIRLIGRNAFLRWIAVAVAAQRKGTTDLDKELVRHAIERGRLLEQLGGAGRDGGTLFLVGLFSLLDAVFRMPLTEILERVSLSSEVCNALLTRSGPYAVALDFAESHELGLFENTTGIALDMGVDPSRINDFYTNAIMWAAEALDTASDHRRAGDIRRAS